MKLENNIEAENCGRMMMKKYNFKKVLITRGEKGLSLITKKSAIHSPTSAKEIFDVSGAGDTVLAVVAACIPNKIKEDKVLSKTVLIENLDYLKFSYSDDLSIFVNEWQSVQKNNTFPKFIIVEYSINDEIYKYTLSTFK